jgi:pimeloyl-ACP methyl ester carboxylesterase
MPKNQTNGIELEYDCFGDPTGEPLLLIMGLGTQMIAWREEFCGLLADHGHFVVRFDNRDVGLSTKFGEHGPANPLAIMQAVAAGEPVETAYSVNDMADDSAGLLDALGLDSAHVCGASMGGMIAQVLATRHPQRVRSLTSIMSSTGAPDLPGPAPEIAALLVQPPASEREAAIAASLNIRRSIAGKGFEIDELAARELAECAYDRCYYPEGTTRQLAAILTAPSRLQALQELAVPTLVIHGSDDALVPLECGRDTAERIPDAELLIIEGMGHDLPEPVWGQITDAVASNAQKAVRSR